VSIGLSAMLSFLIVVMVILVMVILAMVILVMVILVMAILAMVILVLVILVLVILGVSVISKIAMDQLVDIFFKIIKKHDSFFPLNNFLATNIEEIFY